MVTMRYRELMVISCPKMPRDRIMNKINKLGVDQGNIQSIILDDKSDEIIVYYWGYKK